MLSVAFVGPGGHSSIWRGTRGKEHWTISSPRGIRNFSLSQRCARCRNLCAAAEIQPAAAGVYARQLYTGDWIYLNDISWRLLLWTSAGGHSELWGGARPRTTPDRGGDPVRVSSSDTVVLFESSSPQGAPGKGVESPRHQHLCSRCGRSAFRFPLQRSVRAARTARFCRAGGYRPYPACTKRV